MGMGPQLPQGPHGQMGMQQQMMGQDPNQYDPNQMHPQQQQQGMQQQGMQQPGQQQPGQQGQAVSVDNNNNNTIGICYIFSNENKKQQLCIFPQENTQHFNINQLLSKVLLLYLLLYLILLPLFFLCCQCYYHHNYIHPNCKILLY